MALTTSLVPGASAINLGDVLTLTYTVSGNVLGDRGSSNSFSTGPGTGNNSLQLVAGDTSGLIKILPTMSGMWQGTLRSIWTDTTTGNQITSSAVARIIVR